MRGPDGEPWTLEEFTAGAEMVAEWSVVQSCQLTADMRVDSGYYRPGYLVQEARIAALRSRSLSDLAFVSDGNHMTISDKFTDSGVRYLRGQDLSTDFFISDANPIYIPFTEYEKLQRSHMKPGDVLLSIVGTIGSVALVTEKYQHLTGSCKIAIVRSQSVNPYYLATYLASRVGQDQIARRIRGAVQQGLILPDLREFPVPVIGDRYADEIEALIRKSHKQQQRAEDFYTEAEALLLAELGLDDLNLSHQATYTRNSSQVWTAGRLDAEHFQPKYYALLAKLQEAGKAVRLGDCLTGPVRRGVQPKYDENGTVIVINSQHVIKTHVELEGNRCTTQEFAQQNERAIVHPYDVLLNSTGYITIGRCQTLLDDVPAIVDGHVSIIRPQKGLDPVYLGMFLNSLPGQMQTERSWTGSSGQIELRSELIEDYTVWRPDEAFQRRIRGLIEDAYVAREEACRLLEKAKWRVEEMVLGSL